MREAHHGAPDERVAGVEPELTVVVVVGVLPWFELALVLALAEAPEGEPLVVLRVPPRDDEPVPVVERSGPRGCVESGSRVGTLVEMPVEPLVRHLLQHREVNRETRDGYQDAEGPGDRDSSGELGQPERRQGLRRHRSRQS